MFLNQVLMALAGVCAGFATSAGVIALLITLGVIPRIIGRTQTGMAIMTYETMLAFGGVSGCILSVFDIQRFAVGSWVLVFFGLCSGIFVGCQAVALAEILNMFPILFRRMKLQVGLSVVIISMALGKMAGSALYFFLGW